jgi:acyl-CoA thioester hydrolase
LQEQGIAAAPHTSRLRVRYAETDQMGVVYHANYLIWMEIGRVELVRSRGLNYKDLEESEGLFLAVVEANCRYIYPARYDQEIVVQTVVSQSNHRLVQFAYEIRCSESDRLLASGSTRHVWLDRHWRPVRLPEKYHAALRVK